MVLTSSLTIFSIHFNFNTMNTQSLFNSIFATLEKEDQELSQLSDEGIFYAPELYIAILMGKAIKTNESEIFNAESKWIRETLFGNGGPTDFAFQVGNTKYVFELKLRDTVHSYINDVQKLKSMRDKEDIHYEKYFIALVDSYTRNNELDGRISSLEQHFPDLRRIAIEDFASKQSRYTKRDIFCNVVLWKVE